MHSPILFITASYERYQQLSKAITSNFGVTTTYAPNARAAVGELRRPLSLAVLDDSVCEGSIEHTDTILRNARNVPVLEINFSSTERISRHIGAILARREREAATSALSAKSLVQADLRGTLSGLLLRSELMLQEVPSEYKRRAQEIVEIASTMRQHLHC